MSDIVLGIDLGTTNTVVSIWRNNKLEIIPDNFGNKLIPSVVSFYNSIRMVGQDAKQIKDLNQLKTIYEVKRLIGSKYSDKNVQNDIEYFAYNVVQDENTDNILIKIDDEYYKPEEISAIILNKIKKMANDYLGFEVLKCVITVPAYFNDNQRLATLNAGKIAGLDVIRIINEPTAAALAYGLNKKNKQYNKVLVVDIGGGTTDVSIVDIDEGIIRVIASTGDTHLGGKDFDNRLIDHIVTNFIEKNDIKEKFEITALKFQQLKKLIENSKKVLSTNDKTLIQIDNFINEHDLKYNLTKNNFENICNDIFMLCIKPIDDVLKSANINKEDIDDIVLVGGTTRIPKLQNCIANYFNKNVTQLNNTINPDEVVSAGAAIYGYILTHTDDPFSENIIILDVLPLSLGIETLSQFMTIVIPRNSTIPIKKTMTFTNDTDEQPDILINVFEGERKLTKDNYHICSFELKNIVTGPKGYSRINITFEIDINGILKVTAYDKRSTKSNAMSVNINSHNNLSFDEINNMIEKSKQNEQEDNKYRDKIICIYELRKISENIMFNIEHNNEIKMNNEDKIKIKNNVMDFLNYLNMTNIDNIDIDKIKEDYKYLEKKYTNLTFKYINETNNINLCNEDTLKCDEIELNLNENNQNIKKTLTELCDIIIEANNDYHIKITNEDKKYINDYIDTIYIWICMNEHSTIEEYTIKINEVNHTIDEVLNKYNETEVINNGNNYKQELNYICKTLHNIIKQKHYNLNDYKIIELENMIKNNLILINNNKIDKNDIIYEEKIKEINNYCNNLYE